MIDPLVEAKEEAQRGIRTITKTAKTLNEVRESVDAIAGYLGSKWLRRIGTDLARTVGRLEQMATEATALVARFPDIQKAFDAAVKAGVDDANPGDAKGIARAFTAIMDRLESIEIEDLSDAEVLESNVFEKINKTLSGIELGDVDFHEVASRLKEDVEAELIDAIDAKRTNPRGKGRRR